MSINFKKIASSQRTLVMGILNCTPDSFSDGGLYNKSVAAALVHTKQMLLDGVDIIDVGGESTRPGAKAVSIVEEIGRVLPVIIAIRKKFGKKTSISIDTNKAQVAAAALKAGANLVNSLGGFIFDSALAGVIARAQCPVIVYHIKGEPRTMQLGEIQYKNVIREVTQFFKTQIAFGMKQGIKREQLILDPGIGFGKSVEHNLTIIKKCSEFKKLKLPILVGVSRKSHLGKILQSELGLHNMPVPAERVEAGLAEVAVAVLGGVKIIRTHDVLQTKKFLAVLDKLK